MSTSLSFKEEKDFKNFLFKISKLEKSNKEYMWWNSPMDHDNVDKYSSDKDPFNHAKKRKGTFR